MKDNVGFFQTIERDNGYVYWNGFLVEKIGGNKIKLNNKEFDITKGIQNALTNKTYDVANSMNDDEKVVFRIILQTINYNNHQRKKGAKSGRDKYIENKLDDDVRKIITSNTKTKTKLKLKGKGVEEIIIPSNIIDIYTRLEVLLGLKVSGHTDTLTEASNLIDELYKRGEIQNKQKYRNAINKFKI